MNSIYPILILIAFLGLIYLFLYIQGKKQRRKRDDRRIFRRRR